VKYERAKLYSIKDKKELVFEGDFLISNLRMIFDGYEKDFRFGSMAGYSENKNGLEFKMKNGSKYLIRIHDTKTLINTFNNIISKKVKYAIKKY